MQDLLTLVDHAKLVDFVKHIHKIRFYNCFTDYYYGQEKYLTYFLPLQEP